MHSHPYGGVWIPQLVWQLAMGWMAGFDFRQGQEIFFILRRDQNGTPSLLSNGYRRLFSPGVKQPGREGDHSPPYNAKVKNDGATISLSHTSS
jgi:hypothetical protein